MEAVDIGWPNFLREEADIMAAGNGKNVSCEKPLECSIVVTEFGAISALPAEEQMRWFVRGGKI
jgi:predicted dehydrogenase